MFHSVGHIPRFELWDIPYIPTKIGARILSRLVLSFSSFKMKILTRVGNEGGKAKKACFLMVSSPCNGSFSWMSFGGERYAIHSGANISPIFIRICT